MNNSFTIEKTSSVKGVAVLMLLFHHLFYGNNWEQCVSVFPFENIIVPGLALYCKVCVAVFLILSGYGLTKSYEKQSESVLKFSLSHLFKLMFQYWFIFVIFVPLSFAFGSRNPIAVYSTGFKGIIKLLIDFLGISNLIGTPTMNATWWFMGIIIPLYVLFPVLLKLLHTRPIEMWLASLIIALMTFFISSRFNQAVFYWICPFVEGMLLAKYNIINAFMNKYCTRQRVVISIFALLASVLLRTRLGIVADSFMGLSIIFFVNDFADLNVEIKKCLCTLGKYSADIFMMHTFIYGYYFKNIFYSLKYPFFIYITVLLACLIIAIVLEKLKKITKYNLLEVKIQQLIKGR